MRRWVRSAAYQAAVATLVEIRHKAGLTQRDLAKKLGKPPSFIAKIEQGERRLDVIEFIAIARALETTEVDAIRAVASGLPKRIEI